MKKLILLSALFAASVGAAFAQTNHNLQNGYKQYLTSIKADTTLKGLLNNNKSNQSNLLNLPNNQAANAPESIVYSTMPVVGSSSNSNSDLMPVAKLGDANTRYTLLVKRIRIVRPAFTVPSQNQVNADTDKK